MSLVIFRTAERPSLGLWLRDSSGTLIDFTAGYSFVFKIGDPGSSAEYSKNSGITGAAGAGTEPTGTPNVVIAFSSGDLDTLTRGEKTWQLKATTASTDRYFEGTATVKDIIT